MHLSSTYHRGYSVGQLLQWNFTQPKFYKKTLKSITPTTLLIWHYFLDIFTEMPIVFVKNFTFFAYTFLNKLFELVELVPLGLIFKTSYVLSLVKSRRIKKRIVKQLRFA